MSTTLFWLIRYGHVAGAAVWMGGYLVLAFVLIPALAATRDKTLDRFTHLTVRMLTYAGTATVLFGFLLIPRTRGYGSLLSGEWGGIVISCLVIAVALLGLGDGALRPALRRMAETGRVAPARRWALAGFALTTLAVGLMTRALYAAS